MILAIDPGARGCGCAISNGANILKCWYEQNPVKKGTNPADVLRMCKNIVSKAKDFAFENHDVISHTYVEVMLIHRRTPNPTVIQVLTAISYVICAYMWPADSTALKPSEWKGTVDGDVFTERIKKRMTASELALVEEKRVTYAHNAYDAAGILLKQMGRI